MKIKLYALLVLFGLFTKASWADNEKLIEVQVLVIGGGASGTMAGLQAARMGAKTLIMEPLPWLGGMLTSAGVSAIDGNHNLPSGLWAEFREELYKWYGGEKNINTGWVSNTLFEPSVGARILRNMTYKEKNLQVLTQVKEDIIYQTNKGWVVMASDFVGKKYYIKAQILIDATELGDVAAKLKVAYDVGMDAKTTYSERIAPDKANDVVQDLTYVLTLKDFGVGNDYSIPKPDSYNREDFICACETFCPDKKMPRLFPCEKMLTYGALPNKKIMINWPIHGNDFYLNLLELSPEERETELKKAKEFSMNFLYFIQQELGYKHIGLALDEYPTGDHLPMIPYHRESRRTKGLVTFTMNDMEQPFDQAHKLYRTGIAVGDYPVDQHHGKNTAAPDLYYVPVPSYTVPLGSLIPANIENLIVAEKSISVSNLANGATRLQPVVMEIGQAAGALAAISAKTTLYPRQVPVRQVQEALLKSGGYLLPYLDLKPNQKNFGIIQRIGATGIMKGIGKNVGWSNQTWFYMDSTMTARAFWQGLKEFEAGYKYEMPDLNKILTVEESLLMIMNFDQVAQSPKIEFKRIETFKIFVKDRWINEYGLSNFDPARPITRGELAVLLDKLLDPFHTRSLNHDGYYLD